MNFINRYGKYSFIILIVLLFSTSVVGQKIKIKEAGIEFILPNKLWNLTLQDQQNQIFIHQYKREEIISNGFQVIPNLAIIVEPVPDSMNVIEFSLLKRMSVPFSVLETFISTDDNSPIQFENAIAYKGIYEDKQEIEHTILLVHLINDLKGIQFIIDITSGLYQETEDELLEIIGSIRKSGK